MIRFKVGYYLPGLGLLFFLVLSLSPGFAATAAFSKGQLVYFTVYSQIFFGNRPQAFDLSVTLSLRNIPS